MPELDYILGVDDQNIIFENLFQTGAIIIPNLAYEAPEYIKISNASELLSLIQQSKVYGPFFVSWEAYKTYQYKFDIIIKDDGTRYFLKQKQGGPYMDFVGSKTIEKIGAKVITVGFIAHYSRYWIEEIGSEIPPSSALISQYKLLAEKIKKNCILTHVGKRAYWIGRQAQSLLKSGYVSPPVENRGTSLK